MDKFSSDYNSKRVLAIVLGDVFARLEQPFDLSMLSLPQQLSSQLHAGYLTEKIVFSDGAFLLIKKMLDNAEQEINTLNGEYTGWPEFYRLENASLDEQLNWAPDSAVALKSFFRFQSLAAQSTTNYATLMQVLGLRAHRSWRATLNRSRQSNSLLGAHPMLAGQSREWDINVASVLLGVYYAANVDEANFQAWWELTRPYYEVLTALNGDSESSQGSS